jgi:hypothetical protein
MIRVRSRGISDVGGAANITIVSCRAHPDYEFKTLRVLPNRKASLRLRRTCASFEMEAPASFVTHEGL